MHLLWDSGLFHDADGRLVAPFLAIAAPLLTTARDLGLDLGEAVITVTYRAFADQTRMFPARLARESYHALDNGGVVVFPPIPARS